MPRPSKSRRVAFLPQYNYFKPDGIPHSRLEEVLLNVEELEALRLKDLENLEQEDCASRMGISRPTFQRILTDARVKVAEALVNGRAIRIEGGNFQLEPCRCYCEGCGHKWEIHPAKEIGLCPFCSSRNVFCEDCRRRPGGRGWGRCSRKKCGR